MSTDANLWFCRLIVEASRIEFCPDDRLPSAHRGLDPAALIVAGGFLPGHPAPGRDFRDMTVSRGWFKRRLRASNRQSWEAE